jgi:hypothetical protein
MPLRRLEDFDLGGRGVVERGGGFDGFVLHPAG